MRKSSCSMHLHKKLKAKPCDIPIDVLSHNLASHLASSGVSLPIAGRLPVDA